MHSVAITSASGRINLETTAAVSAEVVHVGSVMPVGVDSGIVVESTLQQTVLFCDDALYTGAHTKHDSDY